VDVSKQRVEKFCEGYFANSAHNKQTFVFKDQQLSKKTGQLSFVFQKNNTMKCTNFFRLLHTATGYEIK